MTELPPKPELPRRFYTTASLEPREDGTFAVLLDGRPVRTPARRPLALPSERAGSLVAAEWQAQGERIDPTTMPLTRLANTVLDGIVDDPSPVRADLARYAETDLLVYRAGSPERLAERQRAGWDPVIRWAEDLLGARLVLGEGVMHVAQPQETLRRLRGRLERTGDAFALAALHQMTTLTGSLLLALAVFEGRLTAGEAWALAHIDEDWNIEMWGADEEAAARRGAREAEMRAAARLIGRD